MHRNGGGVKAAVRAVVARAPLAAFEQDFFDAAREQFGDGVGFVLCGGEEVEFVTGGQEDVGRGEGLLECVVQAGRAEQFAAQVGVEGDAAAARLDGVQRVQGECAHAGRGECAAHQVQVVAAGDEGVAGGGRFEAAAGAVGDVEDEAAAAVCAVANEGAAGAFAGGDGDAAGIHAVLLQAAQVEGAEIVVADARDDGAGCAQFADLVDEDGGRTGGVGAGERLGFEEAITFAAGDDFDEDFADGEDFFHGCLCGFWVFVNDISSMRGSPVSSPQGEGDVSFCCRL